MLGDDLDDLAYFVLVNANRGWWQPGAALDVDFVNDRAYDPLIGYNGSPNGLLTYSSPSPKMVFWPDKLLRYAPHNLITYSDQFDNAAWGKAQATISPDTTTAPDGTTTADSLLETASNNIHYMGETISSSPAGKLYIVSAYLKANTRSYATLGISDISSGSLYAVAVFNLSNGTVSTSGAAGTGYSVVSTSVTSVGNGWYRCAIVAFAGSSVSSLKAVVGINKTGVITGAAGGFESYLGDGSGIYVWGAMLSQGSYLFGYIPTTSAAVFKLPYDCDPATGVSKGALIEAASTNLLTYSEQFDNAAWVKVVSTITADATTSPDGSVNADAQLAGVVRYAATIAADSTNTISIFVKSLDAVWVRFVLYETATIANRFSLWANLSTGALGTVSNGGTGSGASTSTASITSIGNGWYRLSVAGAINNSATAVTYQFGPVDADNSVSVANVTDYLWGAQLEAGTLATSYIPTTSATVARAADNIYILTNQFSYNTLEGTVAEDIPSDMRGTGNIVSLSDGTLTIRPLVLYNSTTTSLWIFSSGSPGTNNQIGTVSSAAYKVAAAYKLNDYATSFNGQTPIVDNTAVVDVPNRLNFGNGGAGTVQINGHIRRLTYWPVRKSNSDLVTLSKP